MCIKKCINCNSDYVIVVKSFYGIINRYYVECQMCHFCGSGAFTMKSAVKKWNKL